MRKIIDFECVICGTIFKKNDSGSRKGRHRSLATRIAPSNRVTCSPKCSKENQRKHQGGQNVKSR